MNEILDNDLFKAFSAASSHVYIYVCDVKLNLSRWSENAIEYFDMPGEYMIDAASIWLEKVHPDDRKIYIDDIESVFSGNKDRHNCEYRAQNKYGDYIWLECRGTMIYDENHQPKIFAGMMTRLDAKNKYDPLTNLKTIHEFNLLDFSVASGSILLVGIDSFRQVINNFSYTFGDAVLCEFCRRMEEYCGEQRFVYRLEGDEFLIVSPNESKAGTKRLFQGLCSLTTDLGRNESIGINLSISGGSVLYPEDGIKRDLLLSNLEHSLEHAKKYKRGNVVFFSKKIADRHNRQILIKHAITDAIHHNFEGFQLYFQPLVSADRYQVISCEALLRWFPNNMEAISAGELVKMLEASGEINDVGYWIVDQVLKKAKRWQEQFGQFMVGFNVSYLQFKDSGFVDMLIQKAEEIQVCPELICIELTESSKIENFDYLIKSLERLRNFGFKISLDDFGIAYSTLLLIRNLPTDSVKIDHSFIMNLTRDNKVDLAIVESVVYLCNKLGIDVVAEGVETHGILDIMGQYNITLFQGYYFAKPMPACAFEKVIYKVYK